MIAELPSVLSQSERLDQMQKALNSGFPFLAKLSDFHDRRLSIVAYGPSLNQSISDLPKDQPIMAMSGAYDFLLNNRIQADFYTAIDPRERTVRLLRRPRAETAFLMASCLHPDFWDILKGHDVRLFHVGEEENPEIMQWIRYHHPAGVASIVGGGSTVANRAFSVASMLGYRKFDVFGMDCSFTGDARQHAAEHTAMPQRVVEMTVDGRVFKTTRQLWQSAKEMTDLLQTHDLECKFYGDGLMQTIAAMIERKKADNGRI